jgi:hypothetical protein
MGIGDASHCGGSLRPLRIEAGAGILKGPRAAPLVRLSNAMSNL